MTRQLPRPTVDHEKPEVVRWLAAQLPVLLRQAYGLSSGLSWIGGGAFGYVYRVGRSGWVVKATIDWSEAYVAASLIQRGAQNRHLPEIGHVVKVEPDKAPDPLDAGFFLIVMEYVPYKIEWPIVRGAMNDAYSTLVHEGVIREMNEAIDRMGVQVAERMFLDVVDAMLEAALELVELDGESMDLSAGEIRSHKSIVRKLYDAVREAGVAIIHAAQAVWLDAHAGNIRMRKRNDPKSAAVIDLGYASVDPEWVDRVVRDKLSLRLQNIVRTMRWREVHVR